MIMGSSKEDLEIKQHYFNLPRLYRIWKPFSFFSYRLHDNRDRNLSVNCQVSVKFHFLVIIIQ